MERKKVSSSDITSIGYDESTRTLEVEFKNEDVYQYYDVPKETHESLIKAKSHGKYFHAHIRDIYQYSKIS